MNSVRLVQSGASPRPPRSPEREKLAERIARVDELTAGLDRIRQARAKIGETWEASAAVARAETKLKEAQESEPRRLVDEILGRGSAKSLVADAEAMLKAAAEEKARRGSMHQILDEEERKIQDALQVAEISRQAALGEVLRSDPSVAALYRDYQTARAHVGDLFNVLRAIAAGMPDGWDAFPANWLSDRGQGQLWRAAAEALRTNPDATFPGEAMPSPPVAA